MNTNPKRLVYRKEPACPAVVAKIINNGCTHSLTPREHRQLVKYNEQCKAVQLHNDWVDDQKALREEKRKKEALIKAERKALRTEIIRHKRSKVAFDMIRGILKESLTSDFVEDHQRIYSRMVGVVLREIKPFILTDWISEDAKIKGAKKVEEHFYPMQVAGGIIFQHLVLEQQGLVEPLTFDKFEQYCKVFLQVALTTSDENKVLGMGGDKSPQNYKRFTTPEQAYIDAGVKIEFTPINRVEDVAPRKVLEEFFGDRLVEIYKYNS